MRTSAFFSFAVLASSLLVKEVIAGPLGKRAVVTDQIVVTEEIVVTALPDGSLKTGKAKAIGTKTIHGHQVVTTVRPISTLEDLTTTSSAILELTTASTISTTTSQAAVFKETTKATISAAPVAAAEVETPVSVAPTTTTTTPASVAAPAPTTLAKVVSAAAPASSVISSSAVSSGSSGSSSGGKRGIAFNDASFLSAFTGNPSVSWSYNWGGTTSDGLSEFEYVPMLWGLGEHANNWESFADKAIASGSKHLLAFNEPDLGAQANLRVGEAAAGYLTHMQPYAGKARLGSPAVTNGGDGMGLDWLGQFISACSTCTIDFIAIHWYNGGDAEAFKTHVEKAHAVAGSRKVWITEFQAPGSGDEQIAFLAEVIPWLDSQDYVERYSYFMASDGLLISGSELSTLGKAYVS